MVSLSGASIRHFDQRAGWPDLKTMSFRTRFGTPVRPGWLKKSVPAHEICGFLGMSLEMFQRVYGHHHPDFQMEAVNALSKR
jgi:hypothetical protein